MASLIIAVTTIILIILSILIFPTIKIKEITFSPYWIISLIGALLLIILKEVTIVELFDNFKSSTIGPIPILILFISMTILSIFLDEVGFFKYLASVVTKKASGSQTKIFLYLYILTSILTIFTSNDIIILTFTPFICYFAGHAKINPLPYLVGEFIAANTWSMMLVIGNPTNIYIASKFNIDFVTYALKMVIPTIITGLSSLLILYLIFRKQLKKPIEKEEIEAKIENKFLLILGLSSLLVCTILLAISSYVSLPMWIISFVSAIVLIICSLGYHILKKTKPVELTHTLKRAPWTLIPFLLSMFTIVYAVSKIGFTNQIASFFEAHKSNFFYGMISFLSCNLLNNIPMSVLFTEILESSHASMTNIYTVIAASNIGAYLTPIGALAGIMWMGLLKKQHVNYSFLKFIEYGAVLAIPAMLIAILFITII